MKYIYNIRVFLVPALGIIIPAIVLITHLRLNQLKLRLTFKQFSKFALVTGLLSVMILSTLLYITGEFAYFNYVEPGFFQFNGGFAINFTENLSLSFKYDPGLSLLTVSFLSGLLYGSLLTLPRVCTYPQGHTELNGSDTKLTKPTKSTVSGSVSATLSAVASTTVCCSTSIASVIAPTITLILGPFAPLLLSLSIALLVYSFTQVVLPRFPKSFN